MGKYHAGGTDRGKRLAVPDNAGTYRSGSVIACTADYGRTLLKTCSLRYSLCNGTCYLRAFINLGKKDLSIPSLVRTSSDQHLPGISSNCIPDASETSVANSPVSINLI